MSRTSFNLHLRFQTNPCHETHIKQSTLNSRFQSNPSHQPQSQDFNII